MEIKEKLKILKMLIAKNGELDNAVEDLYQFEILSKEEFVSIMDPLIALYSAIGTVRCDLCKEHLFDKFKNCEIFDQHLVNTWQGWQDYKINLKEKGLLP